MKLSPFSNSLKKQLKDLFILTISKISSGSGDFPRIIEIGLFWVADILENIDGVYEDYVCFHLLFC